jgi:acetoacetate decarboxylase
VDVTSERVATATMGYKYRELDARRGGSSRCRRTCSRSCAATALGRWCATSSENQITDVVVKRAWTGPARLQLSGHVLAPLADLPFLEIVDVSHILTDLTLARVEPVHDHLEAAK